jgi:transcriptional regulator with XRE-family HTH domain
MYDEATIGARLRMLRRWRGMTLTELAGQAGLSASFLSMAERGERMLDRRSHISALAAALRVSEADLVGAPHLGRDPAQTGPHGVVPALRAALTGNTLSDPATDRARPLHDLQAVLSNDLAVAGKAADYERRGRLVAPLIDELHWHAATGDERTRQTALRALIAACEHAGMTLRHLGYRDLAYMAALRAGDAAALLSDPVATAHAAYVRVMIMPKPHGWARPLAIASSAADRLEAHASDGVAAETYGMLHLTAALSAAAAHRPDLAENHLGEARNVAERIGENPDAFGTFGPTNVGIWGLAVAMEYGDYERAVALAADVDTRILPNMERRAMFHADKGRALAHLKDRRIQAINELKLAERLAPQRVRNSGPVQETVLYLLGRHLAATPGRELRGMAARMGMPH